MNEIGRISEPSNGARSVIEAGIPYMVSVEITGVADFLFHRWNSEAVDEKAKAAKGSKAKKTDDVESYVYRLEDGGLAIPGEYLRQSIVTAAKFHQDPRSPRKSAMDLFKAGVIPITNLAPLGAQQWDYLDTRRVVVQRNGVNRTRPAMRAGWRIEVDLLVNTPEYISEAFLQEVIEKAGRLVGVGDFRPTFGRFRVTKFETVAA